MRRRTFGSGPSPQQLAPGGDAAEGRSQCWEDGIALLPDAGALSPFFDVRGGLVHYCSLFASQGYQSVSSSRLN